MQSLSALSVHLHQKMMSLNIKNTYGGLDFLALFLTVWAVLDSIKSDKYLKLKNRISKLEFEAVSELNSRVAFMELISIQDSILNSGNKNKSLNSEIEQACRKVYKFYWKFRHNENAFAYELKFHLQKEQRRLTAEQVHWYFQSKHSPLQKRIHANYVAERNLKYFVEDLVFLVENDPSLKVVVLR